MELPFVFRLPTDRHDALHLPSRLQSPRWIVAALIAITDNAGLTYLGSLVEGLSAEFKTALVAGVFTGGGLTVSANGPDPAGAAILKTEFT